LTLECLVPAKEAAKFTYVIDVILNEFLGIPCSIDATGRTNNIEIFCHGSSKRLVLNNVFLAKELNSFSFENLPKLPLEYIQTSYLGENTNIQELPVLFGTSDVNVTDEEVFVGLDIIGSIFFSLSRYEELVLSGRDEHDRFPAYESVAYKADFLDRPIVDEYVEFLWFYIARLWPNLSRKKKQGFTYISCDVDQPIDTTVKDIRILTKTCIADVFKRRNVVEAVKRIRRYIFNSRGDYRFDPFYSFDWYMDVCERAGLKAVFYFIPTSIEPNNGSYELTDKEIENLLSEINSRGHEIGVHGSYQTFKDGNKLSEQKTILENELLRLGIDQKVRGNRQHYLRWDAEITPELIDKAGFDYDTTGGYADHSGFRYGTAHEFSMWGWQSNRKLILKQRPLIVMECSIIEDTYMGLGKGNECFDYICSMNFEAKKRGGNFSLLWHNSSLMSNVDKELFSMCISNTNNTNVKIFR